MKKSGPPCVGTLTGISVGPGDPELITVKALRRLRAAHTVAFPAGCRGTGVAERAIAPWLSAQQQRLPLAFPYVLDPKTLTAAWQTAAEQVWQRLAVGQDIVFACEGDIGFYSTFSYLALVLKRQHPEVAVAFIPGVCSPVAAAAAVGQPLTQQHQKLAILPALYAVADLETVLTWADVLVLLKVSSVYAQVWQVLSRFDLLEHTYIVQRATTAEQIVYADLRDLPELSLPYFSILVTQIRPWAIAGLDQAGKW